MGEHCLPDPGCADSLIGGACLEIQGGVHRCQCKDGYVWDVNMCSKNQDLEGLPCVNPFLNRHLYFCDHI